MPHDWKGENLAKEPVGIMAITAHPQDPFERAGGAAVKHLERGDEAMYVTLTTGVVTHAFGVFPVTGDDKLKAIDKP